MDLKGSVLRQEVQWPLVVGKGNARVNEGGSPAPVRNQEVAFSLSTQQQQWSSLWIPWTYRAPECSVDGYINEGRKELSHPISWPCSLGPTSCCWILSSATTLSTPLNIPEQNSYQQTTLSLVSEMSQFHQHKISKASTTPHPRSAF